MFSKRKNKCNRGGLLLRTANNIQRANNKNKLIAELNLYGFNEAAKFVHDVAVRCDENDSFCYESGDTLVEAFVWEDTPQGSSYWDKIDNELEIAEDAAWKASRSASRNASRIVE